MKSYDVRYLLGEGFRNTWHNRFMALASVGVLISCLLLTGLSYLFFVNIDHLFQAAYEQNVVAVYMDVGLDNSAVAHAGDALAVMDNVASVRFVSKEEILERYSDRLSPETLESLQGDDNPLQDTYIVSLKDLAHFEETLEQMKTVPGVEDITYDGDIAETLTRVRRLVLSIGGIVIIVLLVVSLFIISNTVKLTVYSRRLEIYIMKSVGATDGFVRFPFVVEGILLGLLAGGAGYGLLYLLYSLLLQNLTFDMAMLTLVPFKAVWSVLLIGFLGGGVLVGVCGSAISMRKYLRREGSLRI